MAVSNVTLPSGERVNISHEDDATELDVLNFAFNEYVTNTDPGSAFGRGIRDGVDLLQTSYGSTLEGIGSLLDAESLEQIGADVIARQRGEMDAEAFRQQRFGDQDEGLIDYTLNLAGTSAPIMGATLAGAGAGFVATGFNPLGAIAGGFLANMPFFYGDNRERQKEAIERGFRTEIDEGAAALYAVPQSILDAAFAGIGAKFLASGALKAGGGLLTRATRGAVEGSIIEAPTELGQQFLNRYQAGLPTDSDEAKLEYVEAAKGGALLGGLFGGGTRAVFGSKEGPDAMPAPAKEETVKMPPSVTTPEGEAVSPEVGEILEAEQAAQSELTPEDEAAIDTEIDATTQPDQQVTEDNVAVDESDYILPEIEEGAYTTRLDVGLLSDEQLQAIIDSYNQYNRDGSKVRSLDQRQELEEQQTRETLKEAQEDGVQITDAEIEARVEQIRKKYRRIRLRIARAIKERDARSRGEASQLTEADFDAIAEEMQRERGRGGSPEAQTEGTLTAEDEAAIDAELRRELSVNIEPEGPVRVDPIAEEPEAQPESIVESAPATAPAQEVAFKIETDINPNYDGPGGLQKKVLGYKVRAKDGKNYYIEAANDEQEPDLRFAVFEGESGSGGTGEYIEGFPTKKAAVAFLREKKPEAAPEPEGGLTEEELVYVLGQMGQDVTVGADTRIVPFTDKEALEALPPNQKAKHLLHREKPIKKGAVRLNLNSRFHLKDGLVKKYTPTEIKAGIPQQEGAVGPLYVQTLHRINRAGVPEHTKAYSYGRAFTIRNATFSVNPFAKTIIRSKAKNKYPMASVDGDIVADVEPNLEGEVLSFNPFVHDSFVDSQGRRVIGADEITVYGTKAYARGNIQYSDAAPEVVTASEILSLARQGKKYVHPSFHPNGIDLSKLSNSEIKALEALAAQEGPDVTVGASQPISSSEDQLNLVDASIDNPTEIETDPGEGGKVRSIAKKYLLRDDQVLDFSDDANINEASDRIASLLERSLNQFPKFSKWYSSRLRMALNILKELDQDLKKPEDQFILRTLLAITSNGNEVSPQTAESYRIYKEWKRTGKLKVSSTTGTRSGAILNQLELFDDLLKKHGYLKMKKFMAKSGTVSQLRSELINNFGFTKKSADKLTNGELVDEVVPFAFILGPKLGSFYNNLNGNFNTTTMDRWFMRTFGRTMGQQFLPIPTEGARIRFLQSVDALINDPQQSAFLDQKVTKTSEFTLRDFLPKDGVIDLQELKVLNIFFTKIANRSFNGKSIPAPGKGKPSALPLINDFRLAVNNLFKAGDGLQIIEAPKSGTHRRFIRKTMSSALSKFNQRTNKNFTPAEAQALLWYYEKLVHDSNGSKQRDEAPDYGTAANKLYKEIKGRDSGRYKPSDAVRRRTPARASGDRIPGGQGSASVSAGADVTAGTDTGPEIADIINEGKTFENVGQLERFIKKLFTPIAKKLGTDIVPNYSITRALQYNVTQGVIEYNPVGIINNTSQYLTAGMREELIHAAMHKVLINQNRSKSKTAAFVDFMTKLGQDLTQDQRQALSDVYFNLRSDADFGAEYSRAVIQQALYGDITEVYAKGKSFEKIKKLFRSIQSFVARLFGSEVSNPEVAGVIRASADLLKAVDPSVRPTNQVIVGAAMNNSVDLNPNSEITSQDVVEAGKPPSKRKIDLNFADKYLFTVSYVLGKIHPRLKGLIRDYYGAIQTKVLAYQTAMAPFFVKMRAIKNKEDRKRLKQLLMYSPVVADAGTAEQEALLAKYGMLEDYNNLVRPSLKKLREDLEARGVDVGDLFDYFPRRIKNFKALEKVKAYWGKTVGLSFKSYIDARNERIMEIRRDILDLNDQLVKASNNNDQAAIQRISRELKEKSEQDDVIITIGSAETALQEAQEWDKFITKFSEDNPNMLPGNARERAIKGQIPDELLQYYEDPAQAMESYIFNMVSATETIKLIGNRFVTNQQGTKLDQASELGKLVQELRASGAIIDQQADKTIPEIMKLILSPKKGESRILQLARSFGYGTLLIEFTSTLSQLYDLPFVMLDNGLIPTFSAMFARNRLRGSDFGIDTEKISQEFAGDDKFLEKVVRLGLRSTGFTKLDQIMKETNLTANYRRFRRLAKLYYKDRSNSKIKIFTAEMTALGYSPAEQDQLIADLKNDKKDSALVRSLLFNKLSETQPLSSAEMAMGIVGNPNLRLAVAMKSFMVKQMVFTKDRMLNDMFGPGRTNTQRLKASKDLAKLLTFMLLIGIPVDALKDFLAGRVGYLDDYLFDGTFRVAGVSRYTGYKIRSEGIGRALFDYATPVAFQQAMDATGELQKVLSGERALSQSKFVAYAPYSDVINRMFGFQKERERKTVKRKLSEGESPLFIPPGAL